MSAPRTNESGKPLLVVRPLGKATVAAKMALAQQIEGLQRQLEESEQPAIVVDQVAVYWLRPGDSTAEMDARAEAIRAEFSADA